VISGSEPLRVDAGPQGLLLLHGFGGTPSLWTTVAKGASTAGITFRAPLLPGHGTTTDQLGRTRFGDWVEAAATQVTLLGQQCEQVVLGGFSAGGAVAAAVAATVPVDGLVLVNPMLAVDPEVTELVVEADESGWGELPEPDLDIADPTGAAGYGHYDAIPTGTLRSMHEHLPGVLAGLGGISAPSLLVGSRQDHVVGTEWVQVVANQLTRRPPDVVWLDDSQHMAPLDVDRDRLAAAIVAFVFSLQPQPEG
jgi:carboxylesterase